MKKATYDKFEDIPQADRDENNYQQNPAGKWVLIIDAAHPVMVKNTELLTEKTQRDVQQQQAVQAAVAPKETEITDLKAKLAQEQARPGLPVGQIAVPAEKALVLNQFETLGKFEDVKAKVEEHGTLKEQTEAANRKNLFAEAAKAHGLDVEAFAPLAESQKLHEKLEMREVPDPKKPTEKVKHYFVKGKDAAGADTSTLLGDFVKTDNVFKPFIASLTAKPGKVRIPPTGIGEQVEDKSASDAYLGQMYQRPDAKKDA